MSRYKCIVCKKIDHKLTSIIRLSLFSIAILSGCTAFFANKTHPTVPVLIVPEPQPEPRQKREKKTDNQPKFTVLSEPITPGLAVTFSHLKAYEGQVLLGNSYLHVILSGVPLEEVSGAFQPAITAIWLNSDDQWKKVAFLAPISFRVLGNGNPTPYRVIGMDVRFEKESASVVYFLSSSKQGFGPAPKIIFTIPHDQPQFDITMPNKKGDNKKPLQQIQWSLQWSVAYENPLVQTTFQQQNMTYIIGARDDMSSAILSDESLHLRKPKPGHYILSSDPSKNLENKNESTVSFLLGSKLMADLPRIISAIPKCASKKKLTAVGTFYQQLIPCMERQNFRKFLLSSPPSPKAIASHRRNVLLTDSKENKVFYLTLRENQDILLSLDPLETYHLTEMTARGPENLGMIKPYSNLARLDLPSRQVGEIQFNMDIDGAISPPIALSITSPNLKNAKLVEFIAAGHEGVQDVGNNFLSIDAFPAQISVPVGSYQISIYGNGTLLCLREIVVSADATHQFHCSGDRIAHRDFLTGFLGSDLLEPSALSKYLKIFQPHIVNKTEERTTSESTINGLVVHNREKTLRLQYFPANAVVRKEWRHSQSKAKGFPLATFSTFAHSRQQGMLELSCPETDINLEELFHTIKRIRPDAMQVFGCRQRKFQDDLLYLIDRYYKITGRRIVMTAAPPFQSEIDHWIDNPLLAFHKRHFETSFLEPDGDKSNLSVKPLRFISLLNKGQYCLTAGGFIEIIEQHLVADIGEGYVKVRIQSQPEIVPTLLEMKSNQGTIAQKHLSKNDEIVEIAFKLNGQHRWFLIELKGRRGPFFQELRVLASSPIMYWHPSSKIDDPE